MPNLLNRCQLWLKCWSELWNQAEAGLLAIPSLVLLLPSRNSNDRRLLELLLLLSSRRPPDFFTRLEQLISGRSSLEHYGFNCLSPPTTTTSTRLLVCLIDTSSSNQSVFLVATGTGRLWRTHATSTRLWTLMAPASWPDDDDRHVSNFMTIKWFTHTKDSNYEMDNTGSLNWATKNKTNQPKTYLAIKKLKKNQIVWTGSGPQSSLLLVPKNMTAPVQVIQSTGGGSSPSVYLLSLPHDDEPQETTNTHATPPPPFHSHGVATSRRHGNQQHFILFRVYF